MSELGIKIKSRRKELGLTLEEIAKKVGVSKQTIQRYETGVISNIPSDKIEKLAKILQTTPGYIMGWEDMEPVSVDEFNKITNKIINDADALRSQLYALGWKCEFMGDDSWPSFMGSDEPEPYYEFSNGSISFRVSLDDFESLTEDSLNFTKNRIQDLLQKSIAESFAGNNNDEIITITPQKKKDPCAVIAAHNDNEDSEQLEKMQRDAIRLKEEAARRRAKRNE